MTIKKLEFDTMFTPWTLDTYQTFDMSNNEYLIEDGKEYDDYNWEYDFQGYLAALYANYIELLNNNILDDVILKVDAGDKGVSSPKEYNHSTDRGYPVFTVNYDKLLEYIEGNRDDFEKNKIQDGSGFWWYGSDDDTMLHYYLKTVSSGAYNFEAYYYDQMGGVEQLDYITCTTVTSEVTTA